MKMKLELHKLIITRFGECLPEPINGTMILARPCILILVTFLKHFALEVWVCTYCK